MTYTTLKKSSLYYLLVIKKNICQIEFSLLDFELFIRGIKYKQVKFKYLNLEKYE